FQTRLTKVVDVRVLAGQPVRFAAMVDVRFFRFGKLFSLQLLQMSTLFLELKCKECPMHFGQRRQSTKFGAIANASVFLDANESETYSSEAFEGCILDMSVIVLCVNM
nr:hypothetical protein [Tanacetum cinerariifolium]